MKKWVSVEQVTRVTRAFSDTGILVHAYLIYGFPTQTVQAPSAPWNMFTKCSRPVAYNRVSSIVSPAQCTACLREASAKRLSANSPALCRGPWCRRI
jgi:hypothetical protein